MTNGEGGGMSRIFDFLRGAVQNPIVILVAVLALWLDRRVFDDRLDPDVRETTIERALMPTRVIIDRNSADLSRLQSAVDGHIDSPGHRESKLRMEYIEERLKKLEK